jgi:hypothetical protein
MISSKFRRNGGRRQNWNPGSIQSTNQLHILVSSRNHKIRECYPRLERKPYGWSYLSFMWSQGHFARDCQRPKVICYGCNQEGHMKNQCPNKAAWGGRATGGGLNKGGNSGGNNAGKRPRPFGKLNYTNLEEVNDSDKTVIGTLQILPHPGKVLFDTGATTSFNSQEFVDLYGIPCNKLDYPITVLSTGGTF